MRSNHASSGFRIGCALIASLLAAPASLAAPPSVPAKVSYQGLLLDDLGQPRTGNVDLAVRVYDALSGGTLLYTQVFIGVALADGVFHVELGPTGEATDPPTDPLTTSLSTALAGDLAATGTDRFLELSVGTEGALSRSQILAVPYAELARTAETAGVAVDTMSVNGLSGEFVTALWESTNLDDSGPPNDDPQEGLADVDGDGLLNFIDPDNDDDGITDSNEVSQGSDINLVTPTLASVAPSSGFFGLPNTVTVTGSSFDPAMSVDFGIESGLSPSNVSPTSFDLDIAVQPAGLASILVTLPNAESAVLIDAYTFVAGNFSVDFEDTTQLSLDVTGLRTTIVGGKEEYAVDINDDTVPDVTHALTTAGASSLIHPGQIAVAFDGTGAVAGIHCRPAGGGCFLELRQDTDDDQILTDEVPTLIEVLANGTVWRLLQPSLEFDASGNPVAGYVSRGSPSGIVAKVVHDRNGDGDFDDANEQVDLESVVASTNLGELAIDPAGRPAYVYHNGSFGIRAAHDRNGDGDFSDAQELVTVTNTGGAPECLGAAFAPDGDLVVVTAGPGGVPQLFRDDNDDGDFDDAGESTAIGATPATACDVETGTSLAVAHNGGDMTLLVDRNDDGDFDDVDENVTLALGPITSTHVEIGFGSDGRAIVANSDGVFRDPTP